MLGTIVPYRYHALLLLPIECSLRLSQSARTILTVAKNVLLTIKEIKGERVAFYGASRAERQYSKYG
jgi:hypothetical protein